MPQVHLPAGSGWSGLGPASAPGHLWKERCPWVQAGSGLPVPGPPSAQAQGQPGGGGLTRPKVTTHKVQDPCLLGRQGSALQGPSAVGCGSPRQPKRWVRRPEQAKELCSAWEGCSGCGGHVTGDPAVVTRGCRGQAWGRSWRAVVVLGKWRRCVNCWCRWGRVDGGVSGLRQGHLAGWSLLPAAAPWPCHCRVTEGCTIAAASWPNFLQPPEAGGQTPQDSCHLLPPGRAQPWGPPSKHLPIGLAPPRLGAVSFLILTAL